MSDNPGLRKDTSDPTLFCTAYKKNRFYMFSRREPDDTKRFEFLILNIVSDMLFISFNI